MRVYVLPIALILCGLAVASPAWAQGKPDFAAARKHYQTAQQAEKAGNYDVAVAEYAAAYDITKDPKILYSVAHAYELGGNKEAAIVYYRRYVNEAKDAKDRDEVKKRIADLEASTGGGTAPPPDGGKPAGGDTGAGTGTTGTGTGSTPGNDLVTPDLGGGTPPGGDTGAGTGETPPDGQPPLVLVDEGSRWQRTAAWVSVGIAAVALTTGAVLGESALSREEDIQRLQDYRGPDGLPTTYNGNVAADYQDAVDDGKAFETYSLVAFSLAGAATVAAVVFFVMDPGPPEAPDAVIHNAGRRTPKQAAKRTWIAPAISPDGAGLTVGWGF